MNVEELLNTVPEDVQRRRGTDIARILRLIRDKSQQHHVYSITLVMTEWGNKSPIGVYRMVAKLVLHGDEEVKRNRFDEVIDAHSSGSADKLRITFMRLTMKDRAAFIDYMKELNRVDDLLDILRRHYDQT